MKFSKSYLAGLFDGEGCIFISRRLQNGKYKLKLPHYVITASINMVHRPLIEMLAEQLNARTWRESIRLMVKELKRSSFLGASDWDADEFGGYPMPGLFEDAEGQYRAKQGLAIPGVCNEQVSAPKGKICSALSGNTENAAETTASQSPNYDLLASTTRKYLRTVK